MATKKLLIAAGGTGGHMFPAQALAETLRGQGWDIAMITDARGRKHAGQIPADPIIEVASASISPSRPLAAIKGVLKIARGVNQAKAFIKSWQPDVVAGFGGYPAFPAMRAAQDLNIPTIIHEQNAVLGRVNRLFAPKAHTVASGFEELRLLKPGANHVVTGNPLRQQIMDAVPATYTPPSQTINVTIVGGSLGARIIAQTVPPAIAALPENLRTRLNIVQQTTEGEIEASRQTYADAGVQAELATFFADIETHLAKAHLVIGRAGASSVSEIAAMGKPSILVPLAIAMDDHQTVNARSLSDHGAAVILPESDFTVEALTQLLMEKLDDTDWLESAAHGAKRCAKLDATDALANRVIDAAG